MKKNSPKKSKEKGITSLTVCGYKSIIEKQSIDICPLTIISGANSSGKSSIIQPLLLLKQTLESGFDPGALLLDGPNVKFTSADQIFSRLNKNKCSDTIEIGIQVDRNPMLTSFFEKKLNKGLDIQKMSYQSDSNNSTWWVGMKSEEIKSSSPSRITEILKVFSQQEKKKLEWNVVRNRCFLELEIREVDSKEKGFPFKTSPSGYIANSIRTVIHIPGLRGNPERTYPVTAVGESFPGTFEQYTASVISNWQATNNSSDLKRLGNNLEKLGLTWKVTAKNINDTRVELQVGRLPHANKSGAHDLVNIADVGFGLSQTLPVLVALLVAEPNQLVYIEQPEIHLHPRSQTALAEILADAANRGVRVVVETHSSLLILGIQTLIAEGKLSPDKVKLHWFTRSENGSTEIKSGALDEAGAFGDWPEDFDDVTLDAQSRYLDAAESRQQRIH